MHKPAHKGRLCMAQYKAETTAKASWWKIPDVGESGSMACWNLILPAEKPETHGNRASIILPPLTWNHGGFHLNTSSNWWIKWVPDRGRCLPKSVGEHEPSLTFCCIKATYLAAVKGMCSRPSSLSQLTSESPAVNDVGQIKWMPAVQSGGLSVLYHDQAW